MNFLQGNDFEWKHLGKGLEGSMGWGFEGQGEGGLGGNCLGTRGCRLLLGAVSRAGGKGTGLAGSRR